MMKDRLRPLAMVGTLAVVGLYGLSFWSIDTTADAPSGPPPGPAPSVRADLTRPAPRPEPEEVAPDSREAELEVANPESRVCR